MAVGASSNLKKKIFGERKKAKAAAGITKANPAGTPNSGAVAGSKLFGKK